MPKHWGLQYQERMRKFADEFTSARCCVNDAEHEFARARKDHTEKQVWLEKAAGIRNAAELAVKKLMEIGPSGLAKLEGETGPAFTVEQMLTAIDSRRV